MGAEPSPRLLLALCADLVGVQPGARQRCAPWRQTGTPLADGLPATSRKRFSLWKAVV